MRLLPVLLLALFPFTLSTSSPTPSPPPAPLFAGFDAGLAPPTGTKLPSKGPSNNSNRRRRSKPSDTNDSHEPHPTAPPHASPPIRPSKPAAIYTPRDFQILQQRLKTCRSKLSKTRSELANLSPATVTAASSNLRSDFCNTLNKVLQGSITAPADIYGETIYSERANAGEKRRTHTKHRWTRSFIGDNITGNMRCDVCVRVCACVCCYCLCLSCCPNGVYVDEEEGSNCLTN